MAISPERMVTELVGTLALVDQRLKAVEEKDWGSSITGIHEALADILERLDTMDPPEEEEEEQQAPPPTPDWRKADRERSRELWTWLIEWCRDTLYPMYAKNVWRPCWYEHPHLRIQLTWLAHFHDWSYEPKANPARAAEWHARWWPFIRDQILPDEFKGCGHKSSDPDRVMLHEVPAGADQYAFEDGGLDDYVEEFVQSRPTKEEMEAQDD